MNESESNLNPMADSGSEDLRGEVQSLKAILSMSLLVMSLFSAVMFVFLYRQTVTLRRQAGALREEVGRFESGGGMNQAAELMVRLGEYAKTHPDYMPIYQKYSQQLTVRQTGNPPPKK